MLQQLLKKLSGLLILINVLRIYYGKVRLKFNPHSSDRYLQKYSILGGKKPLGEHAAVWVPDAEANVCMHCNKSQFNVLNRRVSCVLLFTCFHCLTFVFTVQHHCRKCGAVVCGPCSNKKFLLPVQSAKPLRVCLTCHDVLTKSKNLGGPNTSLSN